MTQAFGACPPPFSATFFTLWPACLLKPQFLFEGPGISGLLQVLHPVLPVQAHILVPFGWVPAWSFQWS